jgi:isopentenyl-diphosphate delta-isomerase
MNSKGQILVPRRAAHKRIAPNGLDYSVAEHVQAGETYEEAIVRGFKEELNMTIDPERLKLCVVGKPIPLPIFNGLFVYHSDEEPTLGDEFTGAEWLLPEEVIKRVEAGEVAKRDLVPSLKLVLQSDGFSTTPVATS